ncbi:MAG: hypothetical protein ACKVH8_15215 [Pirellulales bacterium]|jgi:hypothetical protein
MGDDPLFENDEAPVVATERKRQPWRPRFGIGAMMLLMFVLSAPFAMGYYMVNASESTNPFWGRFGFLFVTLAAPMLLLTVVSVGRLVLRLFDKHLRRRYDE